MSDKTKYFDDRGMIRVFTYGTLKKGHGNHRLFEMANAKFIGRDSITGHYTLKNMGGFPGAMPLLPDDDKERPTIQIKGEVWALEPEGLAAVDQLEGHPNFYRREKKWTDGKKRAWMYSLNPSFNSSRPHWLTDVNTCENGIWGASDEELEYWGIAESA